MEEETIEQRLMRIELTLGSFIGNLRKQNEYLETILHAIHKGDDNKTVDSIRKYLGSGFRNYRNIY